MELNNTFRVAVPVSQAWEVFTDAERVAPCLPGAQLTGVEDEDLLGKVMVKVGPIRAQYDGVARFLETDRDARRIVLRGEGRDSRGQGTASATICLDLNPDGACTEVTVHTDLQITGKVAQFGRNVVADVSDRLVAQFAQNLEQAVVGSGAGSSDPTVAYAPGDTATERTGATSFAPVGADSYLNLTNVTGRAFVRRTLPYGAILSVFLFGWFLGRRWADGNRDSEGANDRGRVARSFSRRGRDASFIYSITNHDG